MSNSPVEYLLEQLITFDKKLTQPIYIQVSQQIINAIQRRYIRKGTILPGTRKFSNLLKIHRNTASSYLNTLADAGLLVKVKIGKFNYYINIALLQILKNR